VKAPAVGAEVFGTSVDVVSRYVAILGTRGIECGLLGPREGERLWERHVLNSAVLATMVPQGVSVVDVGSGAGLPGIPLAILRPDLRIVLLEPLLRRYTFLVDVVGELGLADRVSVVRGRAEDLDDRFDVVVARAVAPLDRLVGWTKDLFGPDGCLLALKGGSAHDEVEQARPKLKKLGLVAEVHEASAAPGLEPTTVVRVSRG